MAGGQRTIRIRFDGDTRGLERASQQGSRAMLRWRSGMLSVFKGVAVGAALAAAAGTAAIVGGVKVVNMAARLELMGRKAKAVFEDQIGRVQKWARANANAMGLTSRELVGLTANFADLLKPMGFSAKTAADMAMKVNGLAGALAEWSGGTHTAAEVSEILSSAMLGERDALKSLGISILDADVQARLLAKGQDKLKGKALEQAKAIATMELIFEKSTDAQKAFAKGGDTLGRTLASMKAKARDFAESLIEKATPAIKDLIDQIGELKKKGEAFARSILGGDDAVKKWDEFRKAIRSLIDELKGLGEAAKPFIDDFKKIAGPVMKQGIDELRGAWDELREALKDPDVRAGLKAMAVVIGVVLLAALLAVITMFRVFASMTKAAVIVFRYFAKAVGFAANSVINIILLMLRALKFVVDIAAKIPGPHQRAMRALSGAIGGAIGKVNHLKDAINGVKSKQVRVSAQTRGTFALQHMRNLINAIQSKSVTVTTFARQVTKRQHGGPVASGRTYLVGEAGPELLRMGSASGHVVPLNSSRRPSPLGGGDAGEFARELVREMTRAGMRLVLPDENRAIGRRLSLLSRSP